MPNESGRLAGKVAIVTGAGSRGPGVGTGKAASTLFAREGASVLLVDAVPERAEDTQVSIEQEGGVASVLQADVTYEADCARIAEEAVARYGRLDILFNNVGIGSPGTVVDVEQEDFDRVMATNISEHGLHQQVCSAAHGGVRRRLHHQHILDSGHTSRQQRREHPHTPYPRAASSRSRRRCPCIMGATACASTALLRVRYTPRWSRAGCRRKGVTCAAEALRSAPRAAHGTSPGLRYSSPATNLARLQA